MRRTLYALLATAALCSCAADGSYTLDGTVEGVEGTLYLTDLFTSRIDSARADANGHFRFSGQVSEATPALLRSTDGRFTTRLFLEPGSIELQGKIFEPMGIRLAGTPSNEALGRFRDSITEFSHLAFERQDSAFRALERRTIAANRDNMLGVTLLAYNLADELKASEMLEEIGRFPAHMQEQRMLSELKRMALQGLKTEPGQPYTEIVQPAPDGTPLKLSSLIGEPATRYVLVEFWASWCRPCMNEVPYLKAAYERFHPLGLEIYGVSFDREREPWLAAIRDEGLKWPQVSELKHFDNSAARDYAVRSIPSNLLIDTRSGRIVATNLRGERLEKRLEELLGR